MKFLNNNALKMLFAYVPCDNDNPAMNAVIDCINPPVSGLETVGIIIPRSVVTDIVRGSTVLTKNHISAITLPENANVSVVEASGATPWADTTVTYNADTLDFTKVATFIAPQHGAGFDAGFTEPILKNRDGFIVILKRKHQNGDWMYPIIGIEKGATGSAGTLDYSLVDTAGCWTLELTEANVPSGETCLWVTNQETTDALFNSLLALAF